MTGRIFDVIVVGAGPAGSYAAFKLASAGHNVAVLEQKREPGIDVCCTGIISSQCFHSFDASPDVILTGISSISLFSPSGRCLRLEGRSTRAYVVDRSLFDKEIASKARSRGACYFLSSYASDIVRGRDGIQVEVLRSGIRETITSRAVVLANGLRPKLPQKLALGRINRFLVGAQAEVETKGVSEPQICLTQELARGSFAWIVPISEGKALAGLLAPSHSKLHLQKFLLSPFCQDRVVRQLTEITQKAVPIATLPRSYGDRVLVVGDAAGQVKPTTGGGIYFGHLGAEIAAEVLVRALSDDDLSAKRLSHYQKRWRARLGPELSRGRFLRRIYGKLSSRQIEEIFEALDSSGAARALLGQEGFSFDWHTRALLAVLNQVLPSLLRRKMRQFFEAGA